MLALNVCSLLCYLFMASFAGLLLSGSLPAMASAAFASPSLPPQTRLHPSDGSTRRSMPLPSALCRRRIPDPKPCGSNSGLLRHGSGSALPWNFYGCMRRGRNAANLFTVGSLNDAAIAVDAPAISESVPEKLQKIWMSDVVLKWKSPSFLDRKWTGMDLLAGGVILLLHLACLAAPFTFTWKAFGVFVLMYFVTGCFGITLSYHRNLAHRSFKLPKWLEYTFAYCGALALQGDPLDWVNSHRYHHQHCDTEKDPHSPYGGFWYSHIGWILDYASTSERVGARAYIGDLARDPFYQFLRKTYVLHPFALAAALYALGGIPFLVWGVAVRTVWVYHITWAVNSVSHVWGSQAWNTGDLSRNNWPVGLLAFGEGWHNNHHAFEYSARHGLEWWQLDLTWYCILALEKMGLATKIKLPAQEHMARMAFTGSQKS